MTRLPDVVLSQTNEFSSITNGNDGNNSTFHTLTARGGEGGGAISDRPLKEFKFRAGIADHDLERKANNMLQYLSKGHAIRVTLTARQRSLNEDAQAISTTLDRVKELIGDKAVEVRGMKANERKSYGNLLLHPNKNS